MLCIVFGLMAAACHEAWIAGDTVWSAFFALAATADVIMYFYAVHLWMNCLLD